MLKTIALVGFAAALVLSAEAAFAVSGNSSAYGTEGYGPTVPTQSQSNFQRHWNNYNQSKRSAREDPRSGCVSMASTSRFRFRSKVRIEAALCRTRAVRVDVAAPKFEIGRLDGRPKAFARKRTEATRWTCG